MMSWAQYLFVGESACRSVYAGFAHVQHRHHDPPEPPTFALLIFSSSSATLRHLHPDYYISRESLTPSRTPDPRPVLPWRSSARLRKRQGRHRGCPDSQAASEDSFVEV